MRWEFKLFHLKAMIRSLHKLSSQIKTACDCDLDHNGPVSRLREMKGVRDDGPQRVPDGASNVR